MSGSDARTGLAGSGGIAEEVRLVLCTVPNLEVARGLGRTLVEERLAACVNLLPQLTSIYRWEDAICEEPEVLLLIKTRKERLEQLQARVLALHPYEVPELLALPVGSGSDAYVEWLLTASGG